MKFLTRFKLIQGLLTIVIGLTVTVCLSGCVAHDEIYIIMTDAVISPNTIADVTNVLRNMGVNEVKPDPSYPSENLHFMRSNESLEHFSVFIPPINQKPWRLMIGVAGSSNFSEYEKLMYSKLVRNLQEKFGKQNVVADTYSHSGQKML